MRRNLVTKMIAVIMSAGMLMHPIAAYADEIPEEKVTYEDVKDSIIDASCDGQSVDLWTNSAEQVAEVDYSDVSDAVEDSAGLLSGAYEDVETAENKFEAEKTDASNMDADLSEANQNDLEASSLMSRMDMVAKMADSEGSSINVTTTTAEDAEQKVDNIKTMVGEAEERLSDAQNRLDAAQTDLNNAKADYEKMTQDASASEAALAAAKDKLQQAQTTLESAQQDVADNANILKDAYAQQEEYIHINQLQQELTSTTSGSAEYNEKLNELAQLVIKSTITTGKDDGTEVTFGEGTEEYVTDYKKGENGELIPVTTTVSYKTVTYISGGQEVTKKITYGIDDKKVLTISEVLVTTSSQEVTYEGALSGIYTNKDGEEYVGTDTSHMVLNDVDDATAGFCAIDTKTSEVISHKIIERNENTYYNNQITSEMGADGSFIKPEKDADGNKVCLIINNYKPIEDTEQTQYVLCDEGIAEIKSQLYSLQGSSLTTYSYIVDQSFTTQWKEQQEQEIRKNFGKEPGAAVMNISIIAYDGTKTRVSYNVLRSNASAIYRIATEKTVYMADEYLDRGNSKTIYTVSSSNSNIISSDSEAYTNLITEKQQAAAKAQIASNAAQYAKEDYDRALEAVKLAQTQLESLEKAGATAALLKAQKEKLDKAEETLATSKKTKEEADQYLEQAKKSLADAEAKLQAIKNPVVITPVNTYTISLAPGVSGQDAPASSDPATSSASASIADIPAGAVTIMPTTTTAAGNAQVEGPAVLGASRTEAPARAIGIKLPMLTDAQYKGVMINNINQTAAGGTLCVEFDRMACFDRAMLEAFAKKGNIDMEVVFPYKGKKLSVVIPSGTDVNRLLDKKGYCGFLRLADLLGAEESK